MLEFPVFLVYGRRHSAGNFLLPLIMYRHIGAAWLILVLAVGAALCTAHAHEIAEHRATLVLRDRTHLSMTLFVDTAAVLHRALNPEGPRDEFILALAAMDRETFDQALRNAQTRIQDETLLVLRDASSPLTARWSWPDAERMHLLVRERAMQIVTSPNEHVHAPPVELRAEFVADREIRAIRVKFAPALDRVLVVSYRPTQTWTAPGLTSREITFR